MKSKLWILFTFCIFSFTNYNFAEERLGVEYLAGPDFQNLIKNNGLVLIEFDSKPNNEFNMYHWFAEVAPTLEKKNMEAKLAVCHGKCVHSNYSTSQYDGKKYIFINGEHYLFVYEKELSFSLVNYFEHQQDIWDNIFISTEQEGLAVKWDYSKPYCVGFFKNLQSYAAKAFKGAVSRRIPEFAPTNIRIVENESLFHVFDVMYDNWVIGGHNDRSIKLFNITVDTFSKEYTIENVDRFMKQSAITLFPELRQDTLREITDADFKFYIVLLIDPKYESYDSIFDTVAAVALDHRMRALFTYVDITTRFAKEGTMFFKLLGLTGKEKAHIGLLNVFDKKYYNYEGDLEEAHDIREFVENAMKDKVKQYLPKYKSSEIPIDFDSLPVKPLNREIFMKLVEKQDQNFFIAVCTDITCDRVDEVFKKVGDYFKDRKDVSIGRIDIDKNELDFHPLPPQLLYVMRKDGSKNNIIEYEHKTTQHALSYEAIIVFIESKGSIRPWEITNWDPSIIKDYEGGMKILKETETTGQNGSHDAEDKPEPIKDEL